MQMFLHFYPAIVTMLSMFFYRHDSHGMQKFYRRMTFSLSARKLFISLLMLLMLSFNFCYLHSYGVNLALGAGTVLCLSMFSFRITERSIFWLHTRLGIGQGFIAMLTCVVEPSIWPLSMNLYIFSIGSVFYPSEELMRQLKSPEAFSKYAACADGTLISGYYSR